MVDMPDRKLGLFVRLCIEGRGRLSAKKRRRQFSELSDAEVQQMEAIVSDTLDDSVE